MTADPPRGPYPHADFVDWPAYMAAVYTPPPQLLAMAERDPFWRTFGGQGWGDGGEIERERELARALPRPAR